VQTFKWPSTKGKNPRILCLGAHCDDIEIGCGGTVLRLLEEFPGCHVDWIVFSSNPVRRKEAQQGARLFLKNAATRNVVILSYRDSFFPYHGAKIKQDFEKLKRKLEPDLVFTHSQNDFHQDHRAVNELTWNTFRDHPVLEYEIPKYDGDLGRPNFFVQLEPEMYQNKVRYTVEAFPSQHKKRWFEKETFLSLMRLRGMECNAPRGYAEAFYCRKVVL
jgi:LmbE family N-acetylglucosaminyl deacetylase